MKDQALISLAFLLAASLLAGFGWIVLRVDADTMKWLTLCLTCGLALALVSVTGWMASRRHTEALDKLLHANEDLTAQVCAFKNPWAAEQYQLERDARHAARAAVGGPVPLADTFARMNGDDMEDEIIG